MSSAKKILIASCLFIAKATFAQQTFNITDATPAILEGLQAGYTITGATEKEVGDKGNFSRYNVHFFITNTSSEAKILLYKTGFSLGNDVSPTLVQFNCLNATGARLTAKQAILQAKECNVLASIDDKDCASGKTTKGKRFVQIGYWIKAGETISTNAIMIVPLNEKPDMTATLFSEGATVASASFNNLQNNNGYNNNQQANQQTFVRLKNFGSNNYLHNQNGPLNCSGINFDWWSAQWEILPVNGTNNFQIRNRWKNNFISTENNNMLSDNGNSSKAMWTIEESNTSNVFYIKNVSDNSKLVFQNGQLRTSNSYSSNDASAQWIIEK